MAPSRGYRHFFEWQIACLYRLQPIAINKLCYRALSSDTKHHAFTIAWKSAGRLHLLRKLEMSQIKFRSACISNRRISDFSRKLTDPGNKVQSYISSSTNPFINLSIEDYILRRSPEESTILFLYVNRPCIVIGRNQNPWLEVNLALLKSTKMKKQLEIPEKAAFSTVELVRRRSGGGAVFHDQGNLNWSITCPRHLFDRDKHAEMTVRALRTAGIERARVNERHDIVLDQGNEKEECDPEDTHRTPYTVNNSPGTRPLKVSGSAYKIARQRCLHHATLLINSPNLSLISQYLHSPSKNHIQAKGVESVSSPVTNVGLDMMPFQAILQEEFSAMYSEPGTLKLGEVVGEECLKIEEVKQGFTELHTDDWMWSQTPQFDLFLNTEGGAGVVMNIRHGVIQKVEFLGSTMSIEMQGDIRGILVNQVLHKVDGWASFLESRLKKWDNRSAAFATRLEKLLPVPQAIKLQGKSS